MNTIAAQLILLDQNDQVWCNKGYQKVRKLEVWGMYSVLVSLQTSDIGMRANALKSKWLSSQWTPIYKIGHQYIKLDTNI